VAGVGVGRQHGDGGVDNNAEGTSQAHALVRVVIVPPADRLRRPAYENYRWLVHRQLTTREFRHRLARKIVNGTGTDRR
jgi:hypothetical protein